MSGMANQDNLLLLILFSVAVSTGCLFTFAMYILRATALWRMSGIRKANRPWISWIPAGGSWHMLGWIADGIDAKNAIPFRYSIILAICGVCNFFISCLCLNALFRITLGIAASDAGTILIFILTVLIKAALHVFSLMAFYKLINYYRSNRTVAWTTLCMFFPFMLSVFLFVIRYDNPVSEVQQPRPDWNGLRYGPPEGFEFTFQTAKESGKNGNKTGDKENHHASDDDTTGKAL